MFLVIDWDKIIIYRIRIVMKRKEGKEWYNGFEKGNNYKNR